MTDQGAYIMTRERWIAFLHRSEFHGPILIGQMIKGRITYLREDGRINISLRPVKEKAMDEDCTQILTSCKAAREKCPTAIQRHRLLLRLNLG